MFQQYSQDSQYQDQDQYQYQYQYQDQYQENSLNRPYTQSSVSTTSLPCADHQRPTAPAPAHIHGSLKLPPDTWACSFPHYGSPDPPSRSSTPTLSLPESRPKSLGHGQVTAIGGVSGTSYPSEKNFSDHHRHFRDSTNPLGSWDPEKTWMRYGNTRFDDPKPHRVSYTGTGDDMSGDTSRPEQHAVWILVSLSLTPF